MSIGDRRAWTGRADIKTLPGTIEVQPEWSNAARGRVLIATGATTFAGLADDDSDGRGRHRRA